MGWLDGKVKRTFEKIFKGVAKSLDCNVQDVKIGIVYKDGECLYEAYKNNEFVKNVKIDDYLGMFDSGSHVISATIGQAGGRYAKEISTKMEKEVSPNDVSIILKDNPKEIPHAVLMAFGEKQRMINIKEEFTQDAN